MNQQKKSVSFQEYAEVKQIQPLDQEDLWFSRRDELSFKQRDLDMSNLLSAFTRMTPSDLEAFTGESCRGLEHKTNQNVGRQIQLRRQSAIVAVLSTQTRCLNSSKDASKAISRAYSMVGKTATQYALEVAECDRRQVLFGDRLPSSRSKEFTMADASQSRELCGLTRSPVPILPRTVPARTA